MTQLYSSFPSCKSYRSVMGVVAIIAALYASSLSLAVGKEPEQRPEPTAEQLKEYPGKALPAKDLTAEEESALAKRHCYGWLYGRGGFRVNGAICVNNVYRDTNNVPYVDSWFGYVGDETINGKQFNVYKRLFANHWLYFEVKSGSGVYIEMREKQGGGNVKLFDLAYQIEG